MSTTLTIDLISKHVSPPPEFRSDLSQWARDLKVYLEKYLREHTEDLNTLSKTVISFDEQVTISETEPATTYAGMIWVDI